MDQVPVVSERQFDGGLKLIRALVGHGLHLTGACWARTTDYGRAYLYLVAPEVEGADARPTYGKVRAVLAELDDLKRWDHWLEKINPFDVMLVGPGDRVGQALEWEYSHYPGPGPTLKAGWLGTSVALESGAAFIYPPEEFRPPVPAAAGG